MKSTQTFLSRIFMKDEASVRRVWPFFCILTVVVIAVFAWVVVLNPALQRPAILLPLILLLLAHVLLHWLSPYLMNTMRWAWLLPGIHGVVAFALVMASGSVELALPVYMGLIGETVGIFQKNWQRAAGVLVYLGLSTFNLYLLGDQQALVTWYTTVVPMTVFVVVYVILYTREVFARERAQELLEELEEANRQLAEYAGRIEQLERQRIARELHDTLAQGLAGLILQLEAVDSHLSGKHSDRAQQIVQQAMQRARITLVEARRAIDNLRSMTSEAEDLAAALRAEANHFETTTGTACPVHLDLPESIPSPVGEHALGMVVEALSNIAHHSKGKNAWVKTTYGHGFLLVEVGDDGVGFILDEGLIGSGHYGLLGMRERARLAGGSLEIESQPGAGATLRLRLPL
ncbi:MAG TPA: sensor histidine kinase [Levilinea sp.]|nr:sensor histidine kinase [Levilinea sp.]